MAFVKFTNSGTLTPYSIQENDVPFSGTVYIVNPENNTLVGTHAFSPSGSITYNYTDLHSSLDKYLVIPVTSGYIGEATVFSGFSPTIPVFIEDFQTVRESPMPTGTVIISGEGFESGFPANFRKANSGANLTVTGVVTTANMQGTNYLGFQASDTGIKTSMIDVTDAAASGILCGRILGMFRLGPSASNNFQGGGFALMRQANLTSSTALQFLIRSTNAAGDRYSLRFTTGQIEFGSEIEFGDAIIVNYDYAKYTHVTARNLQRNVWFMVEWEVQTKAILFNVYAKPYNSATDSNINTVISGARLYMQIAYTGQAAGGVFYNTTTLPPAWLQSTDNQQEVGLDMCYLESLTNIGRKGIHRLSILERNTNVSAGQTRCIGVNYLSHNGNTRPQGSPDITTNDAKIVNYLVTPANSPFNTFSSGYAGLNFSAMGANSTSDAGFIFYDINENASCSGITKGLARFYLTPSQFQAIESKLGFSVMRQGTLINSNAYTFEFFRNAANDYRTRIRKGTVYSTGFGETDDYNGTILNTSSTITGVNEKNPLSLEFRWEATASSGTKFEVLATTGIARSEYGPGGYIVDSSPGTIDYKLQQVHTYTDTSSPYTTTTGSTLLSMRSYDRAMLQKIEIRRQKGT